MKNILEVKNCFAFECPLKWENLKKTDNSAIRFCGSCEKKVFKASDLATFEKLSKEKKCVAYRINESTPGIMGETIPLSKIDIEKNNIN